MTITRQPYYLLLVLILLLAAAGRIINIDVESLWVDEGFSYWAIRHDDMLRLIMNDVHPPLYFYGLRGWAGLAGITELALRYFSVLPSILSVAMMVPLAREVERLRGMGRTTLPLLAALMLALADMENYIAQETRMYTWHVLWAVVSTWAFLRWQRHIRDDRGHLPALLVWSGASLLLLYTQYAGAALLAVQGLYVLLFTRGRVRLYGNGALGVVGLAFVPWMLAVVSQQTGNVGTGFNVPSTLESLWAWRDEWFTKQWPLLMGLALIGLFPLRRTQVSTSVLLLGWIILPVAGAYILNFYTPILMDYRLTQITPAVSLAIALGLQMLSAREARPFLVVVIVLYGVVVDDTPRPRPPWREVGQNAARYAQPDDLALAHVTPSGDWQVMYYYERFMPEGVHRRSLRQWQLEDGETYADGLPALLEAHDDVWFMHWSKDTSGIEALRATDHVRTATMTETWLDNELNVYRYDVVPPVSEAITAYESGLQLRDAEVHAHDRQIDLWWSTSQTLHHDYVVSVFLLDENGRLVAQHDSPPFNGTRPTTRFAPNEVVYDPHVVQLADGIKQLPSGTYTVGVKTYRFVEGQIMISPTVGGDEFARIGTLRVEDNGK